MGPSLAWSPTGLRNTPSPSGATLSSHSGASSSASHIPSVTPDVFTRSNFPAAHESVSTEGRTGSPAFSPALSPVFTAGSLARQISSARSTPEPMGGTLNIWPPTGAGITGKPSQAVQYRVAPQAIPMLLRQTDTFAPMTGSTSSHSFASTPVHSPSVLSERAPKRNYTVPSIKPLARTAPDSMTIQRVVTGGSAVSNTTAQSPTQTHRQTSQAASDQGQASSEVNLLANEVWSHLKRRISAEADRRGRW